MCCRKYLNVSCCLFLKVKETSCGHPQNVPKDVRRVTSLGHPQDVNFEPLIQMHFNCIIFNFISPNVSLKHERLSCFIVLGFCRNVLKTSSKGPKVTPGGWCSRDVPWASILNVSRKRISVVIFSVLVHQMCVLGIKMFVIAHCFSLGETS